MHCNFFILFYSSKKYILSILIHVSNIIFCIFIFFVDIINLTHRIKSIKYFKNVMKNIYIFTVYQANIIKYKTLIFSNMICKLNRNNYINDIIIF